MTSLTRRYKRAEAAVFKRLSARLAGTAARAKAAAAKAARGSRQGLTVLVVEDSVNAPRGFQISYLLLAACLAGFVGIVGLTIFLAFDAGAEGDRYAASAAECESARVDLDRFKEEADELVRSYAALDLPLAEIVADRGGEATMGRSLVAQSRASRNMGEARRLAEVADGLEQAVVPLQELGRAVEALGQVKRSVPALWPIKDSIGHLSATYGPNPNPFTGEPYFHPGIDCSNYREGDPIVATADGVVVFAGNYYGYGRSVVLDHPNGYFTRYGHMRSILVHDGQKVKQGQVIGLVGNTGNSTGPHTHYEIFIGSKRVDPIDYLWSAKDRKAPEGTIPFGME